ncbi:PH domain-containing protein [Pontibacter sp. E15-1]|uniref:PH domain-containing protein n=1 Tax=Pontibacter sp. E15-1 TaxID=2919918 RepID=UPI001F501DAF|nr:PH domain-containing protein [Pontibacter sp. E15-1]MCJ8163890.1 PH domain-containing protein [Pontibacter sp. E15-1]
MGLLSGMMGHASEVSLEKITNEFQPILIEDERIERAYKLIRDMLVFTTKRLILVNKQGLTGTKVEYQSVPYGSIKTFSKESAGIGDLDAELKIWLTGDLEPTIKQDFRKGDNINEAYRVLSRHVLK